MKKLLALVLALVMSMSLVTISNAAFDDADEISYKEAVEVMNAVGVLKGYDNGDFGPTDTLTRAQACKIIAYLDLGAKAADAIKGSGEVFSDVPATAWYAGYVEYCAGAGYVSGVGNGKFDPDAKVTGVQFAKMLLCALGYKADVEGYNGSDWSLSIARDANKIDLFDGLSIVISATLTREQAAQMALNALEATCVEYEGGTNVSTSDGTTVTVNATRKEVNAPDGTDYGTGNGKLQLCEKLYKKDINKATNKTDAFGRPATVWTYDGEKVGTYAQEPDATFTGITSENAVYTALKGEKGSVFVKEIYQDGAKMGESRTYSKSVTNNAPYFGNGIKVEAYELEDGDGNDYWRLVAIRDYIGRVTQVNKADKATDTDRSVVIELETLPTGFASEKTCAPYETEDFARKDWVIVNVAVDITNPDYSKWTINVKSAELATKLSDKAVTAYKQGTVNSASVTFGGEKYSYSQNFVGTVASQSYTMTSGNSYDFWLDTYGNVIKSDVYSATNTDYYYVLDMTTPQNSDFGGTQYYKYKVLDMTGSVSVISVMSDKNDSANKGYVVTMEKDSDNDGYMKLTAMSTAYVAGSDTAGYKNSNSATFSNKSATIGSDIVVDNSTVFVLQTGSDSYKAVTGVKNMDSYKSLQTLTGSSVKVASIMKNDVAVVVYMNVYNAQSTTSADNLVYLISNKPTVSYDAKNEYYVYSYKAIVDGELGEVTIKKDTDANMGISSGVGLYKVDSTVDGYVQKLAAITGSEAEYDKLTPNNYEATFKSGVLTLGSSNAYVVADDAVVYAIDDDDNLTVTDAEALDATLDGTAYVVMESDKDATVTAIYFDGTIK